MKLKYLLNEAQDSVQPKTKAELIKIINDTIKRDGPNCDLNFIDTSLITDMSELFKNSKFNGDISKWNVSKVKNMWGMFSRAKSFNNPIGDWDVSNVNDMSEMFDNATSFNQDISKWNVSNVKDMNGMFYNAKSFNQDISKWNVSNVKDMSYMFVKATSFNQDISGWDVSNVKDAEGMVDDFKLEKEGKLPSGIMDK